MKIDAIVFDLDGTLLNDKKEISRENRAALEELRQAGIKIILATGRNDVYVKGIVAELGGIEAIISCNGASIRRSYTDEIIYSQFLDKTSVLEIAKHCFAGRFDFTASVYGAMYCVEYSRRVNIFHEYNQQMPKAYRVPVKVMQSAQELAQQDVLKMFIWQMAGREQSVFLEAFHAAAITVVSSENGGMDVSHAETSKGKAIAIFAERYNIPLHRIAAFGDYNNDISMFETVGYSVAMGNASDKVKAHATYVTKTNNEAGVAWGIKEYLE